MDTFVITAIFSIVFILILLFYEFKRNIMMFQQNSYRPERYLRWIKTSGDSTSYPRLISIFIILFSISKLGVGYFGVICMTFFSIVCASRLARKKYKKPLVVTNRVKRLISAVVFICLVIETAAVWLSIEGSFGIVRPVFTAIVTLMLIYCFSHGVILLSDILTKPFEKIINRKFYRKAYAKLQSCKDLKIIGVTGSYGKTSTKHFLHRILSEQFETLMTPGSFNTTLGVVRTVNEYLKAYHQVFIVEMGAKQKGDIKEICELVHPHFGIVTAVGPQHLETFHDIKNVRDTKFELVDSLPKDGYAILNDDYKIIAEREVNNCKTIRYKIAKNESELDSVSGFYTIFNIIYLPEGCRFNVKFPDKTVHSFETRLFGEYNIANLTAAIAVAVELGMPMEKIKYGVSKIEPVEHRLSPKRMANGVTLLDDAFNSNPAGASMAVEVLSNINAKRRIIITPGMIELGKEQYDRNFEFGKKIASAGIDYILLVGQYNKDAMFEGILSVNKEKEILFFNTFLEANEWLIKNGQSGDVVLIENDLPDTFK